MRKFSAVQPWRGAVCAAICLAVVAFSATFPITARAAAFPERPIRIIVPFAPGGASDLIARVISGPLQQELGQPVIVENHPGANGNIGIGFVAKADPDGYTLLVASSVIFVNLPLQRPGSYDPAKDFTSIADLGGSPDALLVRAESPIKNFEDLLKRAKENPGRITFSSPGIGSISQLGVELLDVRTGIKLVHVPYTGAGPAVQAGLSGTTDLAGVNISAAMPLVKAGKMRAIIQTGDKRWFELPDVPTLAEAGIRNAESETLQVLLAPSGVPTAVRDRLSEAVVKVLKNTQIRDQLLKTGFEVSGNGSTELKKLIDVEMAKWRDVISQANLKVN
jgi:tripartite-type tricarboxylate transporter receptor subunit TctC